MNKCLKVYREIVCLWHIIYLLTLNYEDSKEDKFDNIGFILLMYYLHFNDVVFNFQFSTFQTIFLKSTNFSSKLLKESRIEQLMSHHCFSITCNRSDKRTQMEKGSAFSSSCSKVSNSAGRTSRVSIL